MVCQGATRAPDSVGSPFRKRLLAVGRLDYQKGFELLIEAFARLAADARDWELVIVGQGPLREALGERLEELGIGDAAYLAGEVGNLDDWYRDADLFALSSRFEGFPNALLEAMAHGLPAVSFDCDTGPRDIIRPGVDGLLVAPGDVGALEAALRRLMGDAALREQFGKRATDVRDRFAMERVAELWEDLFHREEVGS
jgi:glycosyltransferase involved in cell wall biosynthesis